MPERPLLMIPGPIEVSRDVVAAAARHPASHIAPAFIEAMGRALENMRRVWLAAEDSHPFIVAGSGTTAMDMAVANLVDPGDRAVVVNTGYFSDRMAEMLRRRGAEVTEVCGSDGSDGHFDTPALAEVEAALNAGDVRLLAATHVDTSTGVRVDAEALSRLAGKFGALSVFDGVCATAAEEFDMAGWGASVYLTGSQKAIGLPPGLALLVASREAMERRASLKTPPPLSLDWDQWVPIMDAYEERRPSYFGTPATSLVAALDVALEIMLQGAGMSDVFDVHSRTAAAMRAAWSTLGLELLPRTEAETANTLSAIRYPDGAGPALLAEISSRGVVVAGGLHPSCKGDYFRVGHMGDVLNRPDDLARTVRAVAESLAALGLEDRTDSAVGAFRTALG